MDPDRPTCAHCGEVLGVYEKLVVVGPGEERETSIIHEPEIARDKDVLLVHSDCTGFFPEPIH
jgi:hypothetical protein